MASRLKTEQPVEFTPKREVRLQARFALVSHPTDICAVARLGAATLERRATAFAATALRKATFGSWRLIGV